MSKLIAIVNSGYANLNSIYKALRNLSIKTVISDDPTVIKGADGIVFPGVGAFSRAMIHLRNKKLETVLQQCIESGKPFLGICLGLQLLFPTSEETGNHPGPLPTGLGAVPGRVKRFSNTSGLPVPHVGWNQATPNQTHPLLEGLTGAAYFYFTHSFYVEPENPRHTLAVTDYGGPFTSVLAINNLLGVQFHPEKSGPAGLRLLSNFGKIIADPTILK